MAEPNSIIIDGETARIILPDGREATIDAQYVPIVGCWLWRTHKVKGGGYAVRGNRSCKSVYLHRLIASEIDAPMIDHIDGDRFNNRRSNLRAATAIQNAENRKPRSGSRSGIRGVGYGKYGGTFYWYAQVMHQGIAHRQYFSATEQGKRDAALWAQAKRNELMTHNNETRSGLTTIGAG
jgi:hypothetical protein